MGLIFFLFSIDIRFYLPPTARLSGREQKLGCSTEYTSPSIDSTTTLDQFFPTRRRVSVPSGWRMSQRTDQGTVGIGELVLSTGSCFAILSLLYRIVKKQDAYGKEHALPFYTLVALIMCVNGIAHGAWLITALFYGHVPQVSPGRAVEQSTKCSILGGFGVLKGIFLQYLWMFLALETFFIVTKMRLLRRGLKYCVMAVVLSTAQFVYLWVSIGFGRSRSGCWLRSNHPGGVLLPSERARYYIATIVLFSVASGIQIFNIWNFMVSVGKHGASATNRRCILARMGFLPAGIVLVHMPQIFNYGFFPSFRTPGMDDARNHFLRLQPFLSAIILCIVNKKLWTELKECCSCRKYFRRGENVLESERTIRTSMSGENNLRLTLLANHD